MKKFCISLLFSIFMPFCVCAQSSTITEFEGEDICGVIATGAIDVNIKMSRSTGVSVILNDESSAKLTLELTDEGYVKVGYGSNTTAMFVAQDKRPKATIMLSELEYLNLSGDAMLLSSGSFEAGEKFEMAMRGSAFASFVDVECDKAVITTKENTKIEQIEVTASENIKITTQGSSNITLKGSAASVAMNSASTSMIDALSFRGDKIDAITSGASLIKAFVCGKANVVSSGVSAFKYVGDGKVTGKALKL